MHRFNNSVCLTGMWKWGILCTFAFILQWMSEEIGHKSTECILFVYWLMMMMKVAFSLKPQWLELEWEDDSFNSCKLSSCSEYTQGWFIWFMINSCECGWSTTFLGEQPARIEVILKGWQKIIVLVPNTGFVLANSSAHLDLYREGFRATTGHWSICSFSSLQLSHPIVKYMENSLKRKCSNRQYC